MFSSSCTADGLIDRAISELGYAKAPEREVFYNSLNDCLARLYSEVIVPRRRYPLTAQNGCANLKEVALPEHCAPLRTTDIVAAWNGARQLRFLPYTVLPLGGKGYYTLADEHLILGDGEDGENLSVDVILRPERFSEENGTECVPFPDEFLSLLLCRMRGDALRLSGEDGEAAKWLGEYNTLLDEFANWLAEANRRRKG